MPLSGTTVVDLDMLAVDILGRARAASHLQEGQ